MIFFYFQQVPLYVDDAIQEQKTAQLMYILVTTVMVVCFFSRHVLIYSQFIRYHLQSKNRVYPSCLLVCIVILIQTGEFLCLGLPASFMSVIFNFQLPLEIDRTNRYQASVIGGLIAAWIALICSIFYLSLAPTTESCWSYHLIQHRRRYEPQTSPSGTQMVLSSNTLPPFIAIDDEEDMEQLPPLIVVDETQSPEARKKPKIETIK